MNIILIGYRGTGKSTVGKILAEKTGLKLKNLDQMIIDKAGMGVPQIVENHGWDHFRDIESEVALEVCKQDSQIIDCGGGIIIREKNREILKNSGPVFWLTASIQVIIDRISDGAQRPSLTRKSFTDEVKDVLEERLPMYKDCSNHEIDTEKNQPKDSAKEIMNIAGI
jgi:shikimate kinase